MQIVHHDRCEPIPKPEAGRVDLFAIDIESPWRDDLETYLSDEERQRRDRYTMPEVRRQFGVVRGSLRLLLGTILNTSPQEVVICQGSSGKPVVHSVEFNVSHSGNRGVIAVAAKSVGVDIELIRPMPNAAGLVERFFSRQEAEQFHALPDELKLAGFFRGWTAKEALLKAAGVGLKDLESCVVDLDPRLSERVVRFDWNAELKTESRDDCVISVAVLR